MDAANAEALPVAPVRRIDSVTYSAKLQGSQNAREHWRVRAKRVKSERWLAALMCRKLDRPEAWPVLVVLTRIGPRKLDSDNVQGALKAVRDGVADWLGVNDGDESKVLWNYGQLTARQAGAAGTYGVRIEVLPWTEPEKLKTWDEVLP